MKKLLIALLVSTAAQAQDTATLGRFPLDSAILIRHQTRDTFPVSIFITDRSIRHYPSPVFQVHGYAVYLNGVRTGYLDTRKKPLNPYYKILTHFPEDEAGKSRR